MSAYRLLVGDCRAVLPTLPAGSVHCVVTSPPYYGLRDYGTAQWEGGDAACDHAERSMKPSSKSTLERHGADGRSPQLDQLPAIPFRDVCGKCGARRIDRQLGLEPTPAEYVDSLLGVFREVWRVLRDDGTVWLNLGDSFAGGGYSNHGTGLKVKDLIGIPWRTAFALQAAGWYLRSDIIWSKPNPMPESVTDRPTKAHEYVFLLTKRSTYYYDAEAIAEPSVEPDRTRADRFGGASWEGRQQHSEGGLSNGHTTRNARTVWEIATQSYSGAHFATFPDELARRCILAGTSARGCCAECGAPWERVVERPKYEPDTTGWRPTCAHNAAVVPCVVLDPFAGSGTVGAVATGNGRAAVLIELNPAYCELARQRCGPLLEVPA